MFSSVAQWFSNLQEDPSGTLITLVYIAVAILISLILHECAHGWVAWKCGDPTAKMLGRLTMNPMKHLDPIGTICMIFLHVGWAKPVPINPRNFRHFRRDYILVSIAGIVTNLLLCIISLIISALLCKLIYKPAFISRYSNNLPDLIDTSHLWANMIIKGDFGHVLNYSLDTNVSEWAIYLQRFFLLLAEINLALAIFNLIPVPPLDGYRLLDMLVFKGKLMINQNIMMYIGFGFMILLFSGVLDGILGFLNSTVSGFLSGIIAVII